jgi:hypothetical protein
MKKLFLFLTLLIFTWSQLAAQANIRTADFELFITHPTAGQEIVGLQTIIKLDAENLGPDNLFIGDTVVINFPGSDTYYRILDEDLHVGDRIKVFDEMITAPQFGSFTMTAYLVEDLSKVTSQGQFLTPTWIDPDSTNNIKTVQFTNVSQATGIDEKLLPACSLYPNPAGQELHIRLNEEIIQNVVITIYDLSGKISKVENVSIQGHTAAFSIQSLKKGMYRVVVNYKDGQWANNFIKL